MVAVESLPGLRIERDTEMNAVGLVPAAHHLSVLIKPSQCRAVAVGNREVMDLSGLGKPLVDQRKKLFQTLAGDRRDGDLVGLAGRLRRNSVAAIQIQEIDLVEHLDQVALQAFSQAHVFKHHFHIAALGLAVGMDDIAHMENEIGLEDFFQSGPKGGHQAGRKVRDEP